MQPSTATSTILGGATSEVFADPLQVLLDVGFDRLAALKLINSIQLATRPVAEEKRTNAETASISENTFDNHQLTLFHLSEAIQNLGALATRILEDDALLEGLPEAGRNELESRAFAIESTTYCLGLVAAQEAEAAVCLASWARSVQRERKV